jgi:hypothetical protein
MPLLFTGIQRRNSTIDTFLMTYPMNGPRQRKSDLMETVFLPHRKQCISENMHDGSSLNVPD